MTTYAIIMAGGNGERFWPLSTPERPKQFLDLFGGKALIRHAVDRLEGLIPSERIFVVTADRFVDLTREVLPMLPAENVIGEPCRRDTAAVAVACGLVLQKGGPDAVGCILTADQLISPVDVFQQTLSAAVKMAADSDAVVTMGVAPTHPETGFGYIECGARLDSGTQTVFHAVKCFVEKPNEPTARFYLAQGCFLWNAGMFVWKAAAMRDAYRRHAADLAPLIDAVAETSDVRDAVARLYPGLRAISVDFAVMEHLDRILVAESRFVWDDVGSWTAVEHHFPQDDDGNTCVGETLVWDTARFEDAAFVRGTGGGWRAGRPNPISCHLPRSGGPPRLPDPTSARSMSTMDAGRFRTRISRTSTAGRRTRWGSSTSAATCPNGSRRAAETSSSPSADR